MRFAALRAAFVLLVLLPARAAAGLPVEKVIIETRQGPRIFQMEVASDDASRAQGLMHRTYLARDAGMLFDFKAVVNTAFWMKDTPLSLDMLFVRQDGTISTIAAQAVPYSTAEIVSAEPIRAVIEINGGLAKRLGIAPGDHVEAPIFPMRR
jgi:uncharacterized membrane protein (UPF0127 family)